MKRFLGILLLVLALGPHPAFGDGGKQAATTMQGDSLGLYVAPDDTLQNAGLNLISGIQKVTGTYGAGSTILPIWAGGTSVSGSAWTGGQYLQYSSTQHKVISATVDLSVKQGADPDLDSAAVTHYRASLFDLPDSSASTPCGATQAGQLMYSTASGKLNICNGTTWGPITYDRDSDGLSTALDDNDAVAFTAPTAAAADVIASQTFRTGASLSPTTGTISTSSAGNLTALEADLVAANILTRKNLFGIVGTGDSIVTASKITTADVLTGKSGWVNGAKVDGAITSAAAGNLASVDADLTAGNIKSGVTVFGITGTYTQAATFARQEFTANGTWTRPSGVDTVYVTLVAGGGGGGARYDNWVLGGNGGGSGGFCHRVKVAATGNVTVTVGSAGSAGGGSGGTSSFAASSTISVGGGGGGQAAGEFYSYGGGGGSASSAGTGSGGRGGNNPFSPANDRPAKPGTGGGNHVVLTGNGSGLYVGGSGGGGGMKADNSAPDDNCTAGANWGSTSGGPCGVEQSSAAAGGGGAASPYGTGGTGGSYSTAGSAGQGYGSGGGGSAGSTSSKGPYAGAGGYCLVEWVAVQ